mgnify:CR=1 FL=1
MIEAQASSVISAAETGCVQSMGIRRYRLWVVWQTGWNERGDCRRDGFALKNIISGIMDKMHYTVTQNMRQTVTVVERYLRYRSCEE